MDGGEEGERGESEVDLPRETRLCAEMGLRVWEKPLYSKGSVLDTVTEKPGRRCALQNMPAWTSGEAQGGTG